MTHIRSIAIAIALAFVICGQADAATGGNTRTWISGKGVDQAGCGPIANPCRTMQYAHDVTASGGEIDVLDGAGYGSVFITKSISIINDGAGIAGVLAPSGGLGIYVSAGPTATVNLQGLTVEGAGVGANGIGVNEVGTLTIANCVVTGFVGSSDNAGNGILVKPTSGSPKIIVTNTTVRNNQYVGLYFRPATASGARLIADRVNAVNNGYGISVTVATASGLQHASISNSLVTANAQRGIENIADIGFSSIYISNTVVTGQAGTGVYNRGANAYTTLSKNELIENQAYDLDAPSGAVYTLQNNNIGSSPVALNKNVLR